MTKKKEVEQEQEKPNPNMELWDRLCKTDPANTKSVQKGTKGRKFTAIAAHSQVMAATEAWGPCGGAWGFSWEWIPDPDMWVATVTLRYPSDAYPCEVSQIGTALRQGKYSLDDDAPKKAITDGLTKCFSYTGMNADVFMGKYDDNKYVQAMHEEFGLNTRADPIHPGTPDRFVPKPKPDPRATGMDRIRYLCKEMAGGQPPREWFQNLAADLGLPTQTDKMDDDQFATIVAELEARWKGADDLPDMHPDPPRDLRVELYAIAERLWPGEGEQGVKFEADKTQCDVDKLSDGEMIRLIRILSGQLKGGKA